MAAGWQNKLARLSQMSWDEVCTRVGQEIHKRGDLLLYRLGRRPGQVRLDSSPSRKAGRFFFLPGEIAGRAELLRTHLPDVALGILHEADDICHHRFRLLGYEGLDYGSEIDWHLDRVHGKRAPLDPWFQIPFLEFAAVGDHKIIWELNRHQHLVTLAKAWRLSRSEKYLHELKAQWRSWNQANPYPLGINWASSLEVAFRSLSWIWVDHLLGDAPGHAEFRAELLPALASHGQYVERYLSTYFSPNTHLLGEVLALFFLGTLYPQFPAAARWQQTGWRILQQEAKRQVRPDGVYFEQSLYYHVYALDFFLYARLLAAQNQLEIPAEYDATLGRMLDVVQSLSQVGLPEGFGDDDGGRLFNPRRNRTEHMTDPLAIGSLAYGRSDLPAARLTEESIWIFGESAVSRLSERAENPAARSAAFPDGGLYILADSQPYAYQMVVDGGPQGIGRCGHGHADALSVRLTLDGRRWLVDAGSGVYISGEPTDRNAFRGTAAHNTLFIDATDQAVPEDPFSWTEIPTTRVENWRAGQTFSYFSGSHDGYGRLADPVIHWRQVVKINDGPCLVRDVAIGKQEHELEVRWHFAADLDIQEADEGVVATTKPSSNDPSGTDSAEGVGLSLILPEETRWQTEVTRSLISPAYGCFEPAPLVRTYARVPLPAELATLLAIRPAHMRRHDRPRLVSMPQAAVQAYEFVEQDVNHGFCFARDKRPWNFGPWFSDAEFLYCRIQEDKLVHLVMVGGTYVAWQNQELLKAPGPSAFFEWSKQGALLNAEPEQFSISPLFQQLSGGAHLPTKTSNHDSSAYVEKH